MRRMIVVTLALLLLANAAPGAETPPACWVQGEVLAAFSVKDIRPVIPAVVELLKANGRVPDAVGSFLQRAHQVIAGRLSVVFTPVAGRPDQPNVLVMVAVDESKLKVDDLIVKTLKTLAAGDAFKFSTVGGLRQLVPKNSPVSLYWSVRNKQLVLGTDRTVVQTIVNPPAKPLPPPKSAAACATLGKHVDWSGDVTGFINLEALFWRKMDEQAKQPPQEGRPDTNWLYKWLAPNQLKAVAFSWTGDGKTGSGRVAVTTPQQPKGLGTMFALPNRPLANLDQIPEQVQVFTATALDMGQLARRYLTLMNVLDPDVGTEFKTELAAFSKELGVDLEKNLLASLRQTTSAARLPGGGMLGVFSVMDVTRPADLQKSIGALAKYNGTPLRTAKRSGRTFYLLPTKPITGYTMAGKRLYYSSTFEAIEEMLALKDGGKTLADSAQFKKLRARLPEKSIIAMAIDAQWATNFAQTALAWVPGARKAVDVNELGRFLEQFREAGPGLSVGIALTNEPDAFVLHIESLAGDFWKALPGLAKPFLKALRDNRPMR
jgi:hypothetical protein